jgi:hypothetical protein
MLRSASVVALSFVGLFVSGCGGATESDLFADAAPGNDASSFKDANVVPETSVPDAVSPDATPPPIDAGPIDATPLDSGPDIAPIVCGATLATASIKCDANGEVCCRSSNGSISAACTSAGSCQQPSVALGCSTTATCTALGLVNNVCCGALVNGPNNTAIVASSKCVPANQCASQGTVRLCDKGGPNVCLNNTSCKTSSVTLPGYDLCLN